MIPLPKIIDRARRSRILVAGDAMVDAYDFCYSAQSRPSPEAPDKPVYTAHRSEKMPGGAGNVAANLAALGVEAALLSVCGDDGNALEALRLCEAAGIRPSLVRDPSRPTTIKTRLYIDDHYLLRRDDELAHTVSPALSAEIVRRFGAMLGGADAVILSDYDKGFFGGGNAQAMIALCRGQGVPVVVDFKPANAAIFSGATVVAPNLKEAREVFPGFDPARMEGSLRAIHDLLGAGSVVVTLGAEGILAYDGTRAAHVPGRKVAAVDPCGCGDTVRACLTLGLVAGLDLADAAAFANHAASLVVQKLGTATLSPAELLKESPHENPA